jgi:hypothetical protein
VLLLVLMHLLTLLTLFLTSLVLWARIAIAMLIVISLVHQLYLHLWAGQVWRSFSLDQRQISLTRLDGMVMQGEVTHQTVVVAACVVLCVRPDGRRWPVCQVIFHDAMQADAFRQLRVRLRFLR